MAEPERDRMLMPPPSSPGSANRHEQPSTTHTNIAMSAATRPPSLRTSSASSHKSSAFSESTKLRVKQIDGDECWACGTEPPHICHVVAQEDRQAPLWVELGLIDFPLTSVLNAIPLCPSCHDQFDCLTDPGFIFIPTDLQFFIEFELQDRERRKRAAERGVTLKREAPTPELYKHHQVRQGIITTDAIGGQYLPVFLKPYLHRGRRGFNIEEFSQPREWHGAPLACLQRCIQALGSPRLGFVDRGAVLKLRQLYDLYFFDDENSPPLCNKLPDPAVQPGPIDGGKSGKKRQPDDVTPGDPHSAKRHQGSREGEGGNSSCRDATTFCPILQREVRAYWALGPDVSTEEAVRQFAPIVARSSGSAHI